MRSRRLGLSVIALALALAGGGESGAQPAPQPVTPAAKRRTVAFSYAAKFLCGVAPDADVPDIMPGRYATKINVHNNTGLTLDIAMKAVVLSGGHVVTPPTGRLAHRVAPDYGFELVCADLVKALRLDARRFAEGFLVIEVARPEAGDGLRDPLDVVAVYTSRVGGAKEQGAALDVEQVPARSNPYIVEWPAPSVGGMPFPER